MASKTNRNTRQAGTHRRIVMVAYDGANALDVVGPLDILGAAVRDQKTDSRYTVDVVSPHGGSICTSPSGVCIQSRDFKTMRYSSIDTLLVAGGEDFEKALENHALLRWISNAAKKSRRVASVCTGSDVFVACRQSP